MLSWDERIQKFDKIVNESTMGLVSRRFWDTLKILYVLAESVPGNNFVNFKSDGAFKVSRRNRANAVVLSKRISCIEYFKNLIVNRQNTEESELGIIVEKFDDKDDREKYCRNQVYLLLRDAEQFDEACQTIFNPNKDSEFRLDLFDDFQLSPTGDDTESDEEAPQVESMQPTSVPEAPSTETRQPMPAPEASSTNTMQPTPAPEASSANAKEPTPASEAPLTIARELTPVPEKQPAESRPATPPTPVREDQPAEPRPATPLTPAIPDQPEPRQPLEDLLPLVDELDGLDLPALLARFSLPAEADVMPRCFGVREPPRVPVSPSDFPELNSLQAEILHLKSQRCPDRVAQAQAKIELRLGPHQELAAQQVWHLSASPLTGYKAALCLPPGKGKTLVSLAFAEMDDFRLVIVVAHNAEGKVNWGRQLNSVRDAGVVLAKSGGFSDTEEAFLDAQEILEASEGKVYVVLTPESLSSVQHTCLINDELTHWKSCLIVDEPHLNFKDPSHHMANHLAEITRFTEYWAIPCIFVTGTLCSKPEDACNWLSGALFSRRLPLGCQCKDAPGIAQAVLRLLEVRMEDARPASEVPEGVIYDINVAQPDNLDSDVDAYKQQWWFTGLDLEDIRAVKYALVAACALWRLGHGSVCFVNNVQLIDKIRKALRAPCMGERFKDFFFMHGEMRDDDRRAVYEGFLEKGGVLVITPAIGGIGLNFTSRAGEHLVKAVFVLCPEFDKEALLQLLGRAARTPNELRGVMFKLVNPSKELQRVDTIIHGKQQGSQHVTGEKLVRLPGAQTKRRRIGDDDEDDRAPARKVLKLQDTPAVVTGLFYAAQCGDAVSTKAGEFWVHQCSPLQPPAVLADARKAVVDLKRKLATVETLEEAMRSLRPRVEPQVEPTQELTRAEPTQEPTRTEPTQEQTLHVPSSPKLPPPGHRPPSPMAQEKSEEREGSPEPPRRVVLNDALLANGIPIPDNDAQVQDDLDVSLLGQDSLMSVPAWGRPLGKSEFSLRDEDD